MKKLIFLILTILILSCSCATTRPVEFQKIGMTLEFPKNIPDFSKWNGVMFLIAKDKDWISYVFESQNPLIETQWVVAVCVKYQGPVKTKKPLWYILSVMVVNKSKNEEVTQKTYTDLGLLRTGFFTGIYKEVKNLPE